MPSSSKAQQRFMGMVHAVQKGDMEAPSKEIEKAADSMTDKAAKDFASTKHKGLPAHVKKENKIDLEDEDLPSAVVPGVSVENTMKTYDASCGCFRTESINELTNNERQIKTGNPNNVFYVFYKGQFEAVYWAMNPSDLIKIYWDKFKVRRPAGSKFKFNPEFVIVPKKEYDKSTSNRYAKLKPYVDKFWDKLQNESVGVNEAKEEWAGLDTIKRGGYGSPTLRNGDKVRMVVDARKNKYYNGVINGSSIKWEDGAKSELSLSMQASNRGDLQVLRPTTKNESVNEGTESDIIAQIKNIAKTHQNNIIVDPKSGKKMRVDAFSASAIATVYDALGDSNKEKFLSSGLLGMQQMAMKLLKK